MDSKNVISIFQNQEFDKILTNPILDISARVWEKDRYSAFKTCYKAMRVIDDLVDNRKSTENSNLESEEKLIETITTFAVPGKNLSDDLFQEKLLEVVTEFKIPIWTWENFEKSMIYDVNNSGFKSFPVFLDYAEGAAIAPASIFMHLCGIKKENDIYSEPEFNVKEAAKPLALFCYLVHIIRDFQKDMNNNLNYFAEDFLKENELDMQKLKGFANGEKITPAFRNLIEKYYTLAEEYKKSARKSIDNNLKYLQPQYQLSLELIYELYLQIFERINIAEGCFSTTELNPSPIEIKKRINKTISEFQPSI